MTNQLQLGSVPERLARNQYEVDAEQPHIEVDQQLVAATGTADMLVRICPAHVYTKESDGTLSVAAAACLECGTCLAVAAPGSLRWHYPRGGYGVSYRRG